MRRRAALGGLCVLLSLACDDGGGGATPDAATDADPGPPAPPIATSHDFVVTQLGFYYPEGLTTAREQADNPCGLDGNTNNTRYRPLVLDDVRVNGFDLDGQVTRVTSGMCGQKDFRGLDGAEGIDYGFLSIIDMIRPARPGQVVSGVLATAPTQGLINVGMRVTGVDDLHNDDDVVLHVVTTAEPPLQGADGKIVPRSSVRVLPDPSLHSTFRGAIVDGVLVAGPADFNIGQVNLLVVEDRVISLRDAMIRATVEVRSDGVVEVDSVVSGWWPHDNLEDVTEFAFNTIGANDGELDCALQVSGDRSLGGETCDATSMIFEVKAVSAFLIGFDEGADAVE